jgi:predicted membrane protein
MSLSGNYIGSSPIWSTMFMIWIIALVVLFGLPFFCFTIKD